MTPAIFAYKIKVIMAKNYFKRYVWHPSWNLEQELLQYNDNLKVLESQSLRDQMMEHAGNILELYK